MRVVNGIHWPNHRSWDIEQALRVARARGSVTLLHHHMLERDALIDQWGDAENEFVFVKLRDGWAPQGIPAAPERLIHVRMFIPNWCEMDPIVWAQHAAEVLSRIRSGGKEYDLWRDPFVGVSAANEQNLHSECGDSDPSTQWRYRTPEHYTRIGRWNMDFWREVDRLIPDRKALSVWSALAYGHDSEPGVPDSEYRVPALRDAINACDVLATHPYGHLEWPEGEATVPGGEDRFWHMLRDFRPAGFDGPHDPGGVLAQIPAKPVLISESGTFSHSDASRTEATLAAMRGLLETATASGRVLGVTWFIWNSDDSHRDNAIWPNVDLRAGLEGLPDYVTSLPMPVAGGGDVEEGVEHSPPVLVEIGMPIGAGVFAATRVRAGEGLFSVARRVYGSLNVAENARRIADANGLPWTPELEVGQVLLIPGYRVERISS